MYSRPHSIEVMEPHAYEVQAIAAEVDRSLAVPWAQVSGPTAIGNDSVRRLTADPLNDPLTGPLIGLQGKVKAMLAEQPGVGIPPAAQSYLDTYLSSNALQQPEAIYPTDSLAIICAEGLIDWRYRNSDDSNYDVIERLMAKALFTVHSAAHMVETDEGHIIGIGLARTDMRVDGHKVASGYSVTEEHSGVYRNTELAIIGGKPYAMALDVGASQVRILRSRLITMAAADSRSTDEIQADAYNCGADEIQAAVYNCSVGEIQAAVCDRVAGKSNKLFDRLGKPGQAFLQKQASLVVDSVIKYKPGMRVPDHQDLASLLGHLAAAKQP